MTAGRLNQFRGDFRSAHRYFEEALDICRRTDDNGNAVFCYLELGFDAIGMGESDEATRLLKQALSLGREIGSTEATVGKALNRLGEAARAAGDYAAAREYYAESLAVRRKVGAAREIGATLINLANVARFEKDYEAAMAYSLESLPIILELDDKRGVAHFLCHAAALCQSLGRIRECAILLSAIDAILTSSLGRLDPLEQHEFDEMAPAIRKALGDEAFEAAWIVGGACHSMR